MPMCYAVMLSISVLKCQGYAEMNNTLKLSDSYIQVSTTLKHRNPLIYCLSKYYKGTIHEVYVNYHSYF